VEDGLVKAAAVGADSGVAEAIVGSALVAVGEDGVSLGGFLEAVFGCGVAGIAVGVVLHGELAVGAFDFLLAGGSFYTENFVVVAFCIGCQCVFLVALVFLLGGRGRPSPHDPSFYFLRRGP